MVRDFQEAKLLRHTAEPGIPAMEFRAITTTLIPFPILFIINVKNTWRNNEKSHRLFEDANISEGVIEQIESARKKVL